MTTDTTINQTQQTQADESLDDMMALGGEGRDKNYFGLISVSDDYDCALVKGAGKVPYDPTDRTMTRLIAWNLEFVCTAKDGSTYTIAQNDITSGSKHKVTLKSLSALGIQARSQLKTLADKYAQFVFVKTGGKFQSKVDARDGSFKKGDWRDETAIKFVALFDTLEAATAAQEAFYTPRNGSSAPAQAQSAKNAPQPISADIDQAARAQLLATLPMLWQLSQQKIDPFVAMLSANSAYATAGIERFSPEVCAITGEIPF